MRHAIAANSCPFCGNAIFDANEFTFRKSVSRVLIKNGLDNDDQINKIVDDILLLASGTERVEEANNQEESTTFPQVVVTRPVVSPVSATPTDLEAARTKARALAAARAAGSDDGLTPAERNAPSRMLTPAPKPTAQMGAPSVDPIATAMREFEEANNLERKFEREDQIADSQGVDEDDSAGVFFMEASESALKAERLKASATAAPRPSFKK